MSYESIGTHRRMALDAVRNAAYARALAEAIGPESVVLDLGAGTGLLGLIAARLGARRVYLVEPEDVVAVAEEIAAANGLLDRVTIVQGRIEDVELPEPVDAIVSVLTGNFLLTEDLLESLVHARDRFLKPGGRLIPQAATMEAAPVSAEGLHTETVAAWSTVEQGVDLGAVRPYAANTISYHAEALRGAPLLAEPQVLYRMDFSRDTYGPVCVQAEFTVAAAGLCHGFAGWCSIGLGDDWLSTGPLAPRVHWSQAFLPLDPPLAVEAGERMAFALSRAPRGDWSWRARAAAGERRHSTLLASPLTLGTLRKLSPDYVPRLTAEGRALADLLALCDGRRSARAIADELCRRAPERYRTAEAALAEVQRLVRRHA